MTNENKGIIKIILNAVLENKKSLIISSLILFTIYSFLYGIWKIPFLNLGIDRMSSIGFIDYLYVFAITLLSATFIALFIYERHNKLASNSYVGVAGIGTGSILSTACPVCQGIVVAGFGSTFLNIPTGFLTPYLGILKIASLSLLMLAIFLKADSIHNKTCRLCVPKKLKLGVIQNE